MTPVALLTRAPSGALVAAPPLMACESCPDAATCCGDDCPEQDVGYGDPMDGGLEGLTADAHDLMQLCAEHLAEQAEAEADRRADR